jgi:glutamate racemase
VFQNAAPLLVPLVEAGEDESPMITLALKQYLEPLLEKNIDTLILGCTHYGLLEEQIKAIVGTGVNIISEGPIVASKLALYLGRHPEIESKLTKVTAKVFYSTDSMERFEKLGSHFFGQPITSQKAELQ